MIRLASVALLLACASCGRGQGTPQVQVADAWARATVPGQTSTAAYLSIRNSGDGADRLTSVSTSAGEASLHSSSVEGGVAKMRPIRDGLAIPAGASVEFAPGGNHIMLTGLGRPLKSGGSLNLSLHFERSGERSTVVRIVAPDASGHVGH